MASTEWEPFKQEIKYLYCYEDKTLSEVKHYMESKYDFQKSKQQYQRQFNKWDLRKNSTRPGDWKFIGIRTEKRKRIDDKESEVHVGGIEFRPEKIKKEKHRAGFVSEKDILADSPRTPPGVVVCTPVSPGMHLEWNTPLPWLQFIRLLKPSQDAPSLSSLLTTPLPQEINMYHHIAGRELMQRLTSIVPWNRLSNPPKICSSSRTTAALKILMPEDSEMKHLALSRALGDPKQSGRNRLIVEMFLLSNNFTSHTPDERSEESMFSDDRRAMEMFNKSGWNDANHIRMLLSTQEPTADAVMEKLFMSAVRLFHEDTYAESSLEERSGIRNNVKNMLEAGMDPNAIVDTVSYGHVSSLQFAAMLGGSGLELAKLLLSYGADATFSHNGDSPLGLVLMKEDLELMELLLLYGADANYSHNENSPLGLVATMLGDKGLELAKFLLSHGADVNSPHNGNYPLGLVASLGDWDLELAKLLLLYGADVNLSPNGFPPLGVAAMLGDESLELAKLLLLYGADVNLSPCGISPLGAAAMLGDESLELVKLLLLYGADVDGNSALECAMFSKSKTVSQLLLNHGAKLTPSCLSAVTIFEDIDDFVMNIINAYPDVNVRAGPQAISALAYAVLNSNLNIIPPLLARGANVNEMVFIRFDNHQAVTTVLGYATLCRNLEAVKLLLSACRNVNPEFDGLSYISPLLLAVDTNNPAIARVLLQAGVSIEAADGQWSMTLLERTIRVHNNSLDLQRLLIEHGAQVDRPLSNTKHPCSAIFNAIKREKFDLVELLIGRGARLNDEYSEPPGTVLSAAIESGNTVLVHKLLAAGARVLGRSSFKSIGDIHIAMHLQQCGILQRILETSGPEILMAALSARDDHLCQYLLEQNADGAKEFINLRIFESESTPLSTAISTRNFFFAETLLSRGAEVTEYEISVAIRSIDINTELDFFRRLLSGARGNLPPLNLPTAVGEAIIHNLQFLEVLREADVDPIGTPDQYDDYWDLEKESESEYLVPGPQSVLEVAVFKGKEALSFLLDWTTWDPRLTSRALAIAIILKKYDLVDSLLACGPDMQEYVILDRYYDGYETTEEILTLQAAVNEQVVPVAKALAKSADVNYLGEGARCRTPLQLAVEKGNMELIKMLLQHGARIDNPPARDGGATALQLAAIKGYIGIARKLIDLGASVNEAPAESNGRTALQGAAEYGRIDMLQMLFNEGVSVVDDGEPHYHKAVELAEHNGHKTAARLLRHFRNLAEVR